MDGNYDCRSVHRSGVYVVSTYMKLYELDLGLDCILGGNGSDYVDTLRYNTFLIPVRCTSSSLCTGTSSWQSQRTGTRARAKVRMILRTYY